MNFDPAENRDLTDRDIHQPKESQPCEHGTGYYLALTFGTLLSSQGADAHDTRPHPWPSFAAASPRYAPHGGSQVPGPEAPNPPAGRHRPGTSPRPAPGLARARRKRK